MKICVTAQGDTLDAAVDTVFGRAQKFIIIDTETMAAQAHDNPAINAMGGAGVQSAQLIASLQAVAVLTGQVGPNAFRALQQAGIAVCCGASGTVREAVVAYQQGKFTPEQAATTGSHTGKK